jgi:pilus assembly protein CpaB
VKRSNRLIIIVGVFLAAVAFVGILALSGRPSDQPVEVATVDIVVTKSTLSPGTIVTAQQLGVSRVTAAAAPAGSYSDPAQLIGSVVRQSVGQGQPLTQAAFQSTGVAKSDDIVRNLKPGLRAVAVQVDALTGVGTLIQPGDHVDVVIAMMDGDNKFPVLAAPSARAVVDNVDKSGDAFLNNTSVKIVVQNAQVLGTMTPPVAGTGDATAALGAPGTPTDASVASHQTVILAVTPQDVETIRFGQLDGNLSLVLRAVGDAAAPPVQTTGITLKQLVEQHGLVAPRAVQVDVP